MLANNIKDGGSANTPPREELLWCSDLEFDGRIDNLSMPEVLDLVQALQEAMAVEQQTFDSLRQQLAHASIDDSVENSVQERLSTALCSSQARLARLCARNMRCFMQAVRAKEHANLQGPDDAVLSPEIGDMIVQRASLGGSQGGSQEGSQGVSDEEEGEEEGSEEGSSSSGFHSLPRAPRLAVAPVECSHVEDKQQVHVPSLNEILCSVKRLRTNHTAMVKSALKASPNSAAVELENKTLLHGPLASRSTTDSLNGDEPLSDSPLYENILVNGEEEKEDNKTTTGLIYENLNSKIETHIYDKPRFNTGNVAANSDEDIEAVYENINFTTGKKSSDSDLSDDSTVYENIEPINKKKAGVNEEVTYDVPWNTRPIYASVNCSTKKTSNKERSASGKNNLDIDTLVPQSTRMLLKASEQISVPKDVDQDSLESHSSTESEHDSEPDIPSPDYGSDDESVHYCTDEQGLAVIVEEPEEEERSSSSSSNNSSSSEISASPIPQNGSVGALPEEGLQVEGGLLDECSSSPRLSKLQENHETLLRQRTTHSSFNTNADQKLRQHDASTTKEEESRLPCVRDLKSHFEVASAGAMIRAISNASTSSSNNHPTHSDLSESIGTNQEDATDASTTTNQVENESDLVEPILAQFSELDEEEEMRKPRPTTRSWDPSALLRTLYTLPEPFKGAPPSTPCVTIEGFLEKLPSGKKKATFWNAWKRRFFRAKDGFLYYYQNSQCEKPSMTMQLMGGKVDTLETTLLGVEDRQPGTSTMLGIDDGKGHYVVVRCASKQEMERWRLALLTHTVENFSATYIQPWPIPKDPALIKDTIIIDLGSSSIRAGILCTQPSLPQLFFPTVVAIDKVTKKRIYGTDALKPDIRASSTIHHPVRPSAKITKYSVDVNAVSGFLQKVFQDLNVDQKLYDVILSVPRSFNTTTQTEILNILFDQFGVRAVNMTHQSVLALYSYNTTSGIVVDVGERIDVVPISDGYIVENGVSRIPYGGSQIIDHLRHFLLQKQYSLVTQVESYLIRHVLENLCFCAQHYNSQLNKYRQDPSSVEDSISIKQFFQDPSTHWETVTLDSGRFQPTEGLFNPEAWGLDNSGVHKMVHRAIQECSMDVRKEMTRSIYLSGGVTMLPGFAERLHSEIDNVTPPSLIPKVHASPYRCHAAYIGACVLANSPGVDQIKVTQQEWTSSTSSTALKKWTL